MGGKTKQNKKIGHILPSSIGLRCGEIITVMFESHRQIAGLPFLLVIQDEPTG